MANSERRTKPRLWNDNRSTKVWALTMTIATKLCQELVGESQAVPRHGKAKRSQTVGNRMNQESFGTKHRYEFA
jgi:hypothetical protein